jgi:hypothetical protein
MVSILINPQGGADEAGKSLAAEAPPPRNLLQRKLSSRPGVLVAGLEALQA